MAPVDPDLEARVAALEVRVAQLEARLAVAPEGQTLAPQRPRQPPPPPPPPTADLEERIGAAWLARAGIVALTTGIAFLVLYRFGELGPATRIALGYLLAGGLAGLGLWLGKKHERLGPIVLGGGLAVAYFVTYALHFVPSVRVIDSQALALGLLAAVVLGIVATAQALRSEAVAGVALFLGLHAGVLDRVGPFTLVSSTLLAAGAAFFLVRNQWIVVPASSIVAVWTTLLSYVVRQEPPPPLAGSLGFAAVAYALFAVALVLRPAGLTRATGGLFSLLNGVGAHVLVAVVSPSPVALAGLAVANLAVTGAAWGTGAFALVAPVYLPLALLAAVHALLPLPEPPLWPLLGLGLAAALLGRLLGHGTLRLLALLLLAGGLAWDARLPDRPVARLAVLTVAALGLQRLAVSPWRLQPPPLGTAPDPGLSLLLAWAHVLLLAASALTLLPIWLPQTWAWLLAAVLLSALGFLWRDRGLRWAGLGALGLSVGRLLLVDLAKASRDERIVALLLLGAVLLGTSYAYSRLRHRLQRWL